MTDDDLNGLIAYLRTAPVKKNLTLVQTKFVQSFYKCGNPSGCSRSPMRHDADHGEANECSNGRCVPFEATRTVRRSTVRQHRKSSSARMG